MQALGTGLEDGKSEMWTRRPNVDKTFAIILKTPKKLQVFK